MAMRYRTSALGLALGQGPWGKTKCLSGTALQLDVVESHGDS